MLINQSHKTIYYYLLQYYSKDIVDQADYNELASMLEAISVRQKIKNQNMIEILDYHKYRGEVHTQKNGKIDKAKTNELRKMVQELRDSLILTDPNKENSMIEKAKATQAEYERIRRLSGNTN